MSAAWARKFLRVGDRESGLSGGWLPRLPTQEGASRFGQLDRRGKHQRVRYARNDQELSTRAQANDHFAKRLMGNRVMLSTYH